MKMVSQYPDSSLCGQACIATALGITLEKAVEAVGHGGATNYPQIIAALDKLGAKHGKRWQRVPKTRAKLPPRALLSVEYASGDGHWMLWWDGQILDPDGDYPFGHSMNRISSYLRLDV